MAQINKDFKNIMEKIAEAREILQKRDLSKSGENKFAKFKYYELKDFLPAINEINKEIGIVAFFNLKETTAELKVCNVNSDDFIMFETPRIDAQMKGANPIQALGATHTYLKRYLYLNAYEIVENDIVDSLDPSKHDNTPKKKHLPYNKAVFCDWLKKKDEAFQIEVCNHYKVFEIDELTDEQLKDCSEQIKKGVIK